MAEAIVYGTAAADVVVRVPRLPEPGDHLSATSLGWRLGGGSANVAVELAREGHRVELIGPFGRDPMGDALIAELGARGVGTDRSFRVDAPTARALILLDPTGERTILGIDGAFASGVFPRIEVPDPSTADLVFVESYLRYPTGIADRAAGALLVAPVPSEPAAGWPADILVGSERQLPHAWRADPYRSARAVAGARLRWLVLTLGSRGSTAYGPSDVIRATSRRARQVDATGAGDAFVAALASALLGGADIAHALAAANDRGAAAVEVMQSVPPEATEALARSWPGAD